MSKSILVSLLLSASTVAFSPSSSMGRLRRSTTVDSSHTFFGIPGNKDVRIYRTSLDMAKVGIFFGTSTGNTENAADLIAAEFGDDGDGPFEIDSIKGIVASKFADYDALVVGTPTWNTGADTERSGTGWDEIYYGEMQDLKIAGKKVAVFGLGDQVSYAENYADATGELHDVFESLGCKMMGYTSQDGYEHEDSKSIRGDKFCGQLLDAVNQEELTEDRIKNWVVQLKAEGILEGGSTPSMVEITPGPSPEVEVTKEEAATDTEAVIAKLEEENAKLRKMLEENSRLLDENISVHSSDSSGYVPHFNPKTGRTMWTSPDGRSCYFTVDTPKMHTSLSP